MCKITSKVKGIGVQNWSKFDSGLRQGLNAEGMAAQGFLGYIVVQLAGMRNRGMRETL